MTSFSFKLRTYVYALSVGVLAGVEGGFVAAGLIWAVGTRIHLPAVVVVSLLAITALATLALTSLLFVRTVRAEYAIARGEDPAAVTWNAFSGTTIEAWWQRRTGNDHQQLPHQSE